MRSVLRKSKARQIEQAALSKAIANAPALRWIEVAASVEYTGVESSIAAGEVLSCEYKGADAYRFISTAVNGNGYPSEDAFYKSFDDGTLSELLAKREEN